MLDGFVVPHAHFRVFHGNAFAESVCKTNTDQISILFDENDGQGVSTDLHLREFTQLEAQVKALQQQQQQYLPVAHPTSEFVGTAQNAALAECFSFYSRLMTAETFTSPDFLSAVFTRLTDHFATSESDYVRKAIVDVFENAAAHVARVSDGSKIVTHLETLVGKESTRPSTVLALRLLSTMPRFVKDTTALHTRLIELLKSTDISKQHAAIQASKRVLAHAKAFQQVLLTEIISSGSVQLVELLPACVRDRDQSAVEQAWNLCASLFHKQVADEDAARCLFAAGELVVSDPVALVPQQLQLLQYVVEHDPRPVVVECAWQAIEPVVTHLTHQSLKDEFHSMVILQLRADALTNVKCAALCALEKLCEIHGSVSSAMIATVIDVVKPTPQLELATIRIVALCAQSELASPTGSSPSLMKLVHYLSPARFARRNRTWVLTLKHSEALAKEMGGSFVADAIARCFVQLIEASRRKAILPMEAAVWTSLSKCGGEVARIVANHPDLFTHDALAKLDSKTKQAVAVCLIQSAPEHLDVDHIQALCDQLLGVSTVETYEVARVAISDGASEIAARMLRPVTELVEHEVFGNWIRTLVAICEVDVDVRESQLVTMDALHRLLQAQNLLRGVVSGKHGFHFQVQFIQARLNWFNALLQAQQFADEIAHTSLPGGNRERRLRDTFMSCADEYALMRSKMLGASFKDQDVLVYHSELCRLLASATAAFLLEDGDAATQSQATQSLYLSHALSTWSATLQALQGDVKAKSTNLAAVSESRRPQVGASVFMQLLRAVVSLPFFVPRQFFRSKSPASRRVRSNLQFLTHSEATAASSKPKSRSQLGVARGTDFTCSIEGVVAIESENDIRHSIQSIEIAVLVSSEKADADAAAKQLVRRSAVPWKSGVGESGLESSGWVYTPFQAPVYVPADLLAAKGNYQVEATVTLVDRNKERWLVEPTGARRHIIVY